MNRKRWQVGLACVAALVVGVATYRQLTQGALAFDRARWMSSEEGDGLLRHRMADRLVSSNALIGKSRADAVAMLGQPNGGGYFRDECLAYRLGMERGFISIDNEWLVVSCDASGKVVRTRVMKD